METTSTVTLQDTIETLLKSKKYATLRDILTTMNPVDIAAIFEELQDEKMPLLYRLLPKDIAADTFVEMDDETQKFLIHSLSDTELKEVLDDKYSYLCVGVRLVAIPLVSLFLLYLFGVRGNMLVATVIATSAPSAATTTMFATKYDRDVPLSVSLVSATTLASIVTMPTIVAISQMFA